MSLVHSARLTARSIPTCAAVLSAALLAGCGDPYENLPMRPAGYWGATQLLEEKATGCLYVVNSKSRDTEAPAPLLRPDGSHMGCKATPASSVGTARSDVHPDTPATGGVQKDQPGEA